MPVTPETAIYPPAAMRVSVQRDGQTLVVRSAFPTWGHLHGAFRAALGVGLALTLASFAASAIGRTGSLASGAGLAPLGLAAAGGILVLVLAQLRRLSPVTLSLDSSTLTISAPPGAPLSAEELVPGVPRPGGTRSVGIGEIRGLESRPDGLVVRAPVRSLVLSWRYQPKAGGIRVAGGFAASIAAFRYDELDWLAGIIERLRCGEADALSSLVGLRADRGAPREPVYEPPVFVLKGVGPNRLRLWVVLAGALLALGIRTWLGSGP